MSQHKTSTPPRIPLECKATDAIFVFRALAADAAMAHVQRDKNALTRREAHLPSSVWSQRRRQLFHCTWALTDHRNEYLEQVVRRGQLLLCWHGTAAIGAEVYQ